MTALLQNDSCICRPKSFQSALNKCPPRETGSDVILNLIIIYVILGTIFELYCTGSVKNIEKALDIGLIIKLWHLKKLKVAPSSYHPSATVCGC